MARKLEVELNAKSNADVVFGRAGRAANKFAGDVSARIMGAVAPMVLLDKGIGLMTSSVDKFAEANKRARKLGVGFADFYKLNQALEDSGVSEETTAKAMKEMSIVLAEAQGGAENQTKALKDLGYTQDQISGGAIDVIDLFMRLADATKNARSEAEKNNMVLTILGKKTGPELANALSAGSAELKKNMEGAGNITDKMGNDAEETQRQMRDLNDTFAAGAVSVWGWAKDLVTGPARLRAMKEAMETVTQGKLDDANATDLLAKELIKLGAVQNKSNRQMKQELENRGDLVDFYKTIAANPNVVGEEQAKRAGELQDKVIARAKELLDLKLKINATEAKPGLTQFGATTMQALGGGYANAREGGMMNQPIAALGGTTPMLPNSTAPRLSESEQIFSDIRSMVKTIDGKIQTPSSNQTNPHFRL